MIPAVSRGGRMRGLLRYLVGPGRENEHRDPHLVAGHASAEAWHGVRLDGWTADRIAEQLDAPRLRTRAQVTVPRKTAGGGVAVDERGRPERADAHVWHCSLSLHPDETRPPSSEPLSDERWAEIAQEFIGAMGFAEQRWVAVRHGLTTNGGDHIHLVVQLVGEDGRPAGVHNDRPRAQEACRQLERRHGLRIVEGRDRKRGAAATRHRQRYRSEREHDQGVIASPEPDREQLERAVRRLAAASASESEFVRRLRSEGLIVRPRFAAGRADQVVGYSVALTPAEGKDTVPHSGGRLAKDLTLPRLRAAHGWTAAEPEAVGEWRRAFDGEPPGVGPESNPWLALPSWEEALEQLRALRVSAQSLPAGEQGAWAQAAGHGAAALYGWAQLAGERNAQVLRELGRQLSLSAQVRAAQADAERPVPAVRSAAVLCAALARPGNQTLFWLALAQELQALAVALRDMHQAAGEAQRAAALAAAVQQELAPLTARLDDEHAAADRGYAETRTALRLARVAQPPLSSAPQPGPSPAASPQRPSPGQPRRPGRGV